MRVSDQTAKSGDLLVKSRESLQPHRGVVLEVGEGTGAVGGEIVTALGHRLTDMVLKGGLAAAEQIEGSLLGTLLPDQDAQLALGTVLGGFSCTNILAEPIDGPAITAARGWARTSPRWSGCRRAA